MYPKKPCIEQVALFPTFQKPVTLLGDASVETAEARETEISKTLIPKMILRYDVDNPLLVRGFSEDDRSIMLAIIVDDDKALTLPVTIGVIASEICWYLLDINSISSMYVKRGGILVGRFILF
jgi:hypothetical protein